jgi:hypothetical protein
MVLVLKFVLELAAKFLSIKRSSYPSYGMELQKNIQNRKITGKIEEKISNLVILNVQPCCSR